jgi:hypothetical protein
MSLKKLSKLKPAKYKFSDPTKGETDRLSMGIMAQDIEKVYPHEKYSVLHKDIQGYYSVDYIQLIAPIIKSIQELSEKIEKIEEKLNK